MKKNITIIVALIILTFTVIYGIVQETKRDIYNGTAVHLIIGPFTPLIIGTGVIFFRMGFLKTFLLSWLITSVSYFALLILVMWHYSFEWQPEWIVFWGIQTVILLIIHVITNLRYHRIR
ncbi:MAG: hypothetical protein K0Q73_8818 [Paenibacillus sp.]|nr:hypothetical protein [Paenibacillus sp.]